MEYYIDLGSSTIKMYQSKKGVLTLKEEQVIQFKEYFVEEDGISRKNYRLLMLAMKELIRTYQLKRENCKIEANGIWRNISREQYEMLRADFSEMGLKFNVISQQEERLYFEKAMQDIYDNQKVLMVNIGEEITELVVCNKGNVVTNKKLSIGITKILKDFPDIQKEKSNTTIEEINKSIEKAIQSENLDFGCHYGIFTIGELKSQKLVKYHLKPNALFHDGIHEWILSYEELARKNKELLEEVKLEHLYLVIQNNKKWIDREKAGAILAQAIFKKAKIESIIPSDLNIINGI